MSTLSEWLRSPEIKGGLILARSYLHDAFPTNSFITLIDPDEPDGSVDHTERTRSFWLDIAGRGPQRILFTIDLLEALTDKTDNNDATSLDILRQWDVATYIRDAVRVPIMVTTTGPKSL